jgi:hypothetical protein
VFALILVRTRESCDNRAIAVGGEACSTAHRTSSCWTREVVARITA